MKGFYKQLPDGSLIRFDKVTAPAYAYTEEDKAKKNLRDGIQWHETLEAALAAFGLASDYVDAIGSQLTRQDKQALREQMHETHKQLRDSGLRKLKKSNRELAMLRLKIAKNDKYTAVIADKKKLDAVTTSASALQSVHDLILSSIQEIE